MNMTVFDIKNLLPQSEPDTQKVIQWIDRYGEALLTRMEEGHLTASSFIFNAFRTKILMVYHNIYQSWSWTGGHADGNADLKAVALKEATEETGVTDFRFIDDSICAVDILPVQAHIKHGKPVKEHVHLNICYALECDENALLRIKPDENSGVAWIDLSDWKSRVSENDKLMIPIYEKIICKYTQL